MARNRTRHWAKTALLICVLLWPVNTIGCALANREWSTIGFEEKGQAYLNRSARIILPRWQYNRLRDDAFYDAAKMTTGVYFSVLLILFVVWFATNG